VKSGREAGSAGPQNEREAGSAGPQNEREAGSAGPQNRRAAGRGRTADPYTDTAVIDERAPRFNQIVVAAMCSVALVTGWWALAAGMGLQLIVGLVWGRRWCLPCVLYFEVAQPLFGEGAIEDSRPPRFANMLGAGFLSLATALHVAGLHTPGWVVVGIVAVLAALAAVTGLCVGCSLYKLSARLRGIRPGATGKIDLAEIGADSARPVVVQFTHPLCTECRAVDSRLRTEGYDLVTIDVSKQRALARKYNVSVVPAAFAVDSDGSVLSRVA
jgi:hypothetical protein